MTYSNPPTPVVTYHTPSGASHAWFLGVIAPSGWGSNPQSFGDNTPREPRRLPAEPRSNVGFEISKGDLRGDGEA